MNTWFYRGQLGLIFIELEKMKDVIEGVLFIVDDEVGSADKPFQTQSEEILDEGLDATRENLWVSQNLVPRHIINALFMPLFSLFEDEMVKLCERIKNKERYQYFSETGRVEMVCLSAKNVSRNPFQ